MLDKKLLELASFEEQSDYYTSLKRINWNWFNFIAKQKARKQIEELQEKLKERLQSLGI